MDKHFECSICMEVVNDPKECSGCDTLFCNKCISKWVQATTPENNCPTCLNTFREKKIDRFILKSLNELKFRCYLCSEVFSYESKREHAFICR